MKRYSRKHVLEAIAYWRSRLVEAGDSSGQSKKFDSRLAWMQPVGRLVSEFVEKQVSHQNVCKWLFDTYENNPNLGQSYSDGSRGISRQRIPDDVFQQWSEFLRDQKIVSPLSRPPGNEDIEFSAEQPRGRRDFDALRLTLMLYQYKYAKLDVIRFTPATFVTEDFARAVFPETSEKLPSLMLRYPYIPSVGHAARTQIDRNPRALLDQPEFGQFMVQFGDELQAAVGRMRYMSQWDFMKLVDKSMTCIRQHNDSLGVRGARR